jgi:hypothetical protein
MNTCLDTVPVKEMAKLRMVKEEYYSDGITGVCCWSKAGSLSMFLGI